MPLPLQSPTTDTRGHPLYCSTTSICPATAIRRWDYGTGSGFAAEYIASAIRESFEVFVCLDVHHLIRMTGDGGSHHERR